MATTMGYRPTGLMICTNPHAMIQPMPKKSTNLKGLRIDTSSNALGITLKPKAPPRPPRRRSISQRIWDRLPLEILNQITKYLGTNDLVKLGLTCRSAYRAVTSINPMLLVRRQHFCLLFKHLADVARVYDGRAAFITDADELFDEMAVSLRNCYGEATSHRLGFYSDFECDFILPTLRDDKVTRDMFIADMLDVYSYSSYEYFLDEELDGPPTSLEDEYNRGHPRHGRWFKLTVQPPVEKKPTLAQRIKKKLGIPSNKVRGMPSSTETSPRLPSISPKLGALSPLLGSRSPKSPSSPQSDFSRDDVKSVILRWARDKITGAYRMSFVIVYACGWGLEWDLARRN